VSIEKSQKKQKHAQDLVKRTENECLIPEGLFTPFAKVMVHLHRDKQIVLVDVEVNRLYAVVICVTEENIAFMLD
jgi:hypothetical protein